MPGPWCFLIAIMLAVASGAVALADTKQQVFQFADVDDAWKAVQQTNRPMLLFVSMEKCHFCEKMEHDTYLHPEIAPSLGGLFVTAKLMRESRPELIKQLGVRAFPTTLVIAPSGALLARIDGYADPKEFVTVLRPALASLAETERTAGAVTPKPARQ